MIKKGFLYKRCSCCGKLWNVSACITSLADVYICPSCAMRRRKRNRRRVSHSGFAAVQTRHP